MSHRQRKDIGAIRVWCEVRCRRMNIESTARGLNSPASAREPHIDEEVLRIQRNQAAGSARPASHRAADPDPGSGAKEVAADLPLTSPSQPI